VTIKKQPMNRVLIVILALVSATVFAQQAKPVQFREEQFDFGSVKEDGGPVVHEFVFTNTSNRPVKILSVQASCGCTTPDWSKDAVAPGKTGFVQASYNPKGRPGYFNKTLTVTTDYEANPIILQIKGNVSTQGVGSDGEFTFSSGNWKFKSSAFNLGKVYLKDEATVRDFQFLNSGKEAVTVAKVVGPEHIKVDVTPKTIKGGEKGHVKITYNGKKKQLYGFQSDNVEIHTDDAENPVKSFSVYATLEDYFGDLKPEEKAKGPRLQLAASSIDFGRLAQNSTMVREVAVTNTGKKELTIKAVQGNCSCISASAAKTSLKPGESTVIKVAFSSADRKGTQQKAVTVYSNDPNNPVQRFTFSAYVQD
jgi:hypothetical protein